MRIYYCFTEGIIVTYTSEEIHYYNEYYNGRCPICNRRGIPDKLSGYYTNNNICLGSFYIDNDNDNDNDDNVYISMAIESGEHLGNVCNLKNISIYQCDKRSDICPRVHHCLVVEIQKKFYYYTFDDILGIENASKFIAKVLLLYGKHISYGKIYIVNSRNEKYIDMKRLFYEFENKNGRHFLMNSYYTHINYAACALSTCSLCRHSKYIDLIFGKDANGEDADANTNGEDANTNGEDANTNGEDANTNGEDANTKDADTIKTCLVDIIEGI